MAQFCRPHECLQTELDLRIDMTYDKVGHASVARLRVRHGVADGDLIDDG